METFAGLFSNPLFIHGAGLGFGAIMGVGLTILGLARFGAKVLYKSRDEDRNQAVQEEHAPYCVHHTNLEASVNRIEQKVDQILLSYLPRKQAEGSR